MFQNQTPLQAALQQDAEGALAIGRQARALARVIGDVHARHWERETQLLLETRNHDVEATKQKGASTRALASAVNDALDTLQTALEEAGRDYLAREFSHRAPTEPGRSDIVLNAAGDAYELTS